MENMKKIIEGYCYNGNERAGFKFSDGILTINEKIYNSEKRDYIYGVTTEKEEIIFCNNEFKKYKKSRESWTVDYYYKFELKKDKKYEEVEIKKINIKIYGDDIENYYNNYLEELLDKGKKIFKLENSEEDYSKKLCKYDYEYKGRNLKIKVSINTEIKRKERNFKIKNYFNVDIESECKLVEKDGIVIVNNICEHIFKFLRIVLRKRLLNIKNKIKIIFNPDEKNDAIKGKLKYCDDDFIKKDKRTYPGNIIQHEFFKKDNNDEENKVIKKIFEFISKGEVNYFFDFIPATIKTRSKFSNSRVLKIFIAFEGEYKASEQLKDDFLKSKDDYLKKMILAKKDLSNLDKYKNLFKDIDGKELINDLFSHVKLESKVDLKRKMILALIKNLYNLGNYTNLSKDIEMDENLIEDKSYVYKKLKECEGCKIEDEDFCKIYMMCTKLVRIRNKFVHEDLSYEMDDNDRDYAHMLEMLIYSMFLRRVGVKDDTIKDIINKIGNNSTEDEID